MAATRSSPAALRSRGTDPAREIRAGTASRSRAQDVAHFFPLMPSANGSQGAGDTSMTTLQLIELRCPICDTRFKSQQVISTNSFGGKRTEFHERAAGTQPLPHRIHTSSRCGDPGPERDFTEEADVSPGLREHVWNEL